MIETEDGNHSYNMDELLTYLRNEAKSRHDLAVCNCVVNPELSSRDSAMEINYMRMYEAAIYYRKHADA
jgi:hypothetical protein